MLSLENQKDVINSDKELELACMYGITNNLVTSNKEVAVNKAVELLENKEPLVIQHTLKSTKNKIHATIVTRIAAITYIKDNKEFQRALNEEIKCCDDLYILMLVELQKKRKLKRKQLHMMHRKIEHTISYYDIYKYPKKVQQIMLCFRYKPKFGDPYSKQLYRSVFGEIVDNKLYKASVMIGKQLINCEGVTNDILDQINNYKIPYELIRKYLYMLTEEEEKAVIIESIKFSSQKYLEEFMKYNNLASDDEVLEAVIERSEQLKQKGIPVKIETNPLVIDLGNYHTILDCTAKMGRTLRDYRFVGENITYLPNKSAYDNFIKIEDASKRLNDAAMLKGSIVEQKQNEIPDLIELEYDNEIKDLLIITNGYQNTIQLEKKVKKMKNVNVTIWVLDDLVCIQKYKGITYVFGTNPECIRYITMLTSNSFKKNKVG